MDTIGKETIDNITYKAECFAAIVRKNFSFLESKYGMKRLDVRIVNKTTPQDAGVVVRYLGEMLAVDIAWGLAETVISILIRFASPSGRLVSSDPMKYLYFEPYIEYVTQGKVAPIIPQAPRTMSVSSIKKVQKAREELFADGIEALLKKLSARMKEHGETILTSKGDLPNMREFHEWLGWDTWKLKSKIRCSKHNNV